MYNFVFLKCSAIDKFIGWLYDLFNKRVDNIKRKNEVTLLYLSDVCMCTLMFM